MKKSSKKPQRKSIGKKVVSNKSLAKKVSSKKMMAKKVVAKKVAIKRNGAKKLVTKKAVAKRAYSKNAYSKKPFFHKMSVDVDYDYAIEDFYTVVEKKTNFSFGNRAFSLFKKCYGMSRNDRYLILGFMGQQNLVSAVIFDDPLVLIESIKRKLSTEEMLLLRAEGKASLNNQNPNDICKILDLCSISDLDGNIENLKNALKKIFGPKKKNYLTIISLLGLSFFIGDAHTQAIMIVAFVLAEGIRNLCDCKVYS